jgi:hypothetical protein
MLHHLIHTSSHTCSCIQVGSEQILKNRVHDIYLPRWFVDGDAAAAAPPNRGRRRVLGLLLHLALRHTVRRGAVRGRRRSADPEEEEFEEDEYILLGCQRASAGGDGGGEAGISNLAAPMWMLSRTVERGRPRTPQKRTRPSLFHVSLRPTRPSVLFM